MQGAEVRNTVWGGAGIVCRGWRSKICRGDGKPKMCGQKHQRVLEILDRVYNCLSVRTIQNYPSFLVQHPLEKHLIISQITVSAEINDS